MGSMIALYTFYHKEERETLNNDNQGLNIVKTMHKHKFYLAWQIKLNKKYLKKLRKME